MMRVLLVGANGFIAREIIVGLKAAGHEVIACVRRSSRLLSALGISDIRRADFTNMLSPEDWAPILDGVDCVVNCVGVFQLGKKAMWKIHYHAPKALYQACEAANIQKVVHISALGVDKVHVDYADSKLAIESFLKESKLSYTVLRPSFVYGPRAYGGSALFRGLCSLPFILPVPGKGHQQLQPVHVDDLVKVVKKALSLEGQQTLPVTGAEKLPVKSVLGKLRAWLGFKQARVIAMPLLFLRLGSMLGNYIRNSPLGSTGMQMMTQDNVIDDKTFHALTETVGFSPRSFTAGLQGMVSGVEDRWSARLYFLRPALRLTIALLWLYSGVNAFFTADSWGFSLLSHTPLSSMTQSVLLYGGATINILLGFLCLCNYKLGLTGSLQTLFILGYTIIASVYFPGLWLDPLGPLLKNIPILVAIWVMMILDSNR